jgi:hypothetical protein
MIPHAHMHPLYIPEVEWYELRGFFFNHFVSHINSIAFFSLSYHSHSEMGRAATKARKKAAQVKRRAVSVPISTSGTVDPVDNSSRSRATTPASEVVDPVQHRKSTKDKKPTDAANSVVSHSSSRSHTRSSSRTSSAAPVSNAARSKPNAVTQANVSDNLPPVRTTTYHT